MKKIVLVLYLVFLINLDFSSAYIPVEVDGKKISMDEIESKENTFIFDKELTDVDVDKLLDKTIFFQGSEYDIEENILINLGVDIDKGYRNEIIYSYLFSESVDLTKTSINEPLKIELLGKELKISEIISKDSFKVLVGKEYELNSGDSIEIDGKTIKLVRVGSAGAIVVDIETITQTIASNSIKTIDGIEVFNKKTYYASNNQAGSSAALIAGVEIFKIHKNGDKFEDNPLWMWYIGDLDKTSGHHIGVRNNPSWTELDSKGCTNLPNNYVNLCLPDLTGYFHRDESGCLLGKTCCGNNLCEIGENKNNCFEDCKVCVDNDRDGFKAGDCNEDCNDNNERINQKFPEICDGLDNNCNKKIDEGLSRGCGEIDIGECSFGTETCGEGKWSECSAVFPTREVCDNLDNNCNGEIDECCSGCSYENKCLKPRKRFEDVYCSLDLELGLQKSIGETCRYDYECAIENCSDGVCKEFRTITKIIVNFVRGLFI